MHEEIVIINAGISRSTCSRFESGALNMMLFKKVLGIGGWLST